jgi:hypothetical protein
MQDYYDLQQDVSHRLTSYSNKWRSKLNHQASLSSYNTTKRAQLQTVRAPEKLVPLIKSRSDAIQEVINTYKKQVERMYPTERFGTVHKHYRSSDMEKLFKNAYSPLSKVSKKLKALHITKKEAEEALRDAKIQYQNLELAGTTSESKLSRANNNREAKQSELEAVKRRITRAEEHYEQEREIYHGKASEIYQQCRVLEQERLDQIRDTLMQFSQAVHTSEYSTKLDAVYEDLLSNLTNQQNTLADLDFWAQTYHVNICTTSASAESAEDHDDTANTESQTTITTQKTNASQENEITVLTTIEENTAQPAAETEEDQSVMDKPTTPAKNKPKKKKNNTADPTTPDATGLNQE